MPPGREDRPAWQPPQPPPASAAPQRQQQQQPREEEEEDANSYDSDEGSTYPARFLWEMWDLEVVGRGSPVWKILGECGFPAGLGAGVLRGRICGRKGGKSCLGPGAGAWVGAAGALCACSSSLG